MGCSTSKAKDVAVVDVIPGTTFMEKRVIRALQRKNDELEKAQIQTSFNR